MVWRSGPPAPSGSVTPDARPSTGKTLHAERKRQSGVEQALHDSATRIRILSRRRLSPMPVAVVKIGVVRVTMPHRLMPVHVGMRLRDKPGVRMLVVLVVDMSVFVFEHVVLVFVIVPLGEVQVKTNGHQDTRKNELQRNRVAEHGHGQHRADEWRKREVGAGASRTEVT